MARARREDRQLTEEVGGAEDPNHRLIAQRRSDTNREVTLHDQVQSVPRVAIVEHDLVALETPASRCREDLSLLFVVEHVEQPRLHGAKYRISCIGPAARMNRNILQIDFSAFSSCS
jgi:hypothetical protein